MIGIVGVGTIGGAIARCLLAQGQSVAIFDTNQVALDQLALQGAKPCLSPLNVADQCATLIASLPSASASEAVAFGPLGIARGSKIETLIETSTMSPALSASLGDRLKAFGIDMLEAPISGSPKSAEAGQVTSMLAGSSELVARTEPIIRSYSRNIFHVGEGYGSAQRAKIINNALCILNIISTFQCLSVAQEAEINLRSLNNILNVSSGRNFATTDLLPRSLFNETPAVTGKISIIIKDLKLFLDAISTKEIPLSVRDRIIETIEILGPHADLDVADGMGRLFGIRGA